MRIAFVSCVKTKSATPELAEHLYISPWFRMAREYAKRSADQWFILSAEHGLLEPGRLVSPYNWTLNGLGSKLRQSWAMRVVSQMDEWGLKGGSALVMAGTNYRQFLMEPLMERFVRVDVPMAGLMMGQQLSWMKRQLEE